MHLSETPPASQNRLLAALSPKSYESLAPNLEIINLPLGEILYHPQQRIEYVYFPHKATVSMVNIMADGSMVEVGVIGIEGMVGTCLLSGDNISPHQAIVQIANGASRMKAGAFKQGIANDRELSNLMQRYVQALFTQVAQTAACNRVHPIVERLARWMLLCQDRMESDSLELTHEFIATMLGTRRAGVSIAAGTLQEAGIISYHRRRVTIRDRERLEEASCECYSRVKGEYDRLLGPHKPMSDQ